MMASPAARAVTKPLASTTATCSSEDRKVTPSPRPGSSATCTWARSPSVSVISVGSMATPGFSVTVTWHEASKRLPWDCTVAVMVAWPMDWAVMAPFSTVATESSLLLQLSV